MVHKPSPEMWTVEPVTVQEPVAVNVTASPDDAVANTEKSGSTSFLFESAPKVIVCEAWVIVKFFESVEVV